ncbi:MAG: ABC transporter permease [Synergistaceae bacterium]|nr:ABC transporter permease [Synergistaceae bacterium]
MLKYICRRGALLIPILLAVTFIVFTLLQMTPGDPAKMILGEHASAEAVAQLRLEMGLNEPFWVQYLMFVKKLVINFDIGKSYVTRNSVANEIISCLPATIKLALAAIFVAIVLGVPIGVISATKQYSIFDNIVMFFGLVGISMPVFWLGLLFILLFSVQLKVLPASGFSSLKHMILPAITVGAQSVAIVARMTRSSMLEVVRQDYIRTIRAKGQKESVIIISHALRNALIPIVTVIGLQFGSLLGGAVMCETIFSIPGVGRLMVEAVKARDYPVVLGGVLFIAIGFSLVNLFIDILYSLIDPKIRSQYK